MTNELESLEISAPKAQVFLSQPAGASDNAAGVGARLPLSRSPSLSRFAGLI